MNKTLVCAVAIVLSVFSSLKADNAANTSDSQLQLNNIKIAQPSGSMGNSLIENDFLPVTESKPEAWTEKDVLDNVTDGQSMPVPEPATLVILGLGSLLISCDFRKNRTVRTAA